MSSPRSSAPAQDFPPQPRVQTLGSARPLEAGGVPLRGGPRGPGRAPQEDSRPAGQGQLRKVNRPQRGCCLLFGGGGHEAGPQPGGEEPGAGEKGWGRGGNRTSRLQLRGFRHHRKRGCGFPGGPPTGSSAQSPSAASFLRPPGRGPCRRFNLGASRSAPLFPSTAGPQPLLPALRPGPRGGCAQEERPVRTSRSGARAELTFHPGLGVGVGWDSFCFVFLVRGFVLFCFL